LATAFGQSLAPQKYQSWRDYGGSADSAQYSALKQINRTNVSRLQVAWTYPIGDGNKYLFNPLVVDDLVYVLGKGNSIVALNAATGAVVWTHSPGPGTRVIVTRGINYWESKDRSDRGCSSRRARCCGPSTRARASRLQHSAITAWWIFEKGWGAIQRA
jgi:quinoprotein glucose dehydrogenase